MTRRWPAVVLLPVLLVVGLVVDASRDPDGRSDELGAAEAAAESIAAVIHPFALSLIEQHHEVPVVDFGQDAGRLLGACRVVFPRGMRE